MKPASHPLWTTENAPDPGMSEAPRETKTEFTDRHEVVRTVCVWRDGACYRIEIIQRLGPPDACAYAALLWAEEEHAGKRALVRDVTFPWVHHDTADRALESALESLTSKLTYPSTGDTEG